MNALLRYAIMKGIREKLIATLLVAPSVMFSMPLLLSGVFELIRGRGAWPLKLYGTASPEETAQVFAEPTIIFGATMAVTAAFWIFRTELSGRTIAFFFLARPAIIAPLTTMLFGIGIGAGSYAIVLTITSILTGTLMPVTAALLSAGLTSILAGAAVGSLLVGFSSEPSMLILSYSITTACGIYLIEHGSVAITVALIVASAVLILAAPFVWRRRCAA